MGPELFQLFYVDSPMFSELFFELSNESFVSETFTDDEWTFSKIQGSFDNATTTCVFSWALNGEYISTADNTDFSGTYYFEYAFDIKKV